MTAVVVLMAVVVLLAARLWRTDLRTKADVMAEVKALGCPGTQDDPDLNSAWAMDWSRLPHEITKAVEAPDGPGVLIEQLTPGLGLAIDHDAGEAVVLEEGTGPLVRIPLYRLRDIDQTLLLEALDDPRATEAAGRGDLLADPDPKGTWVRVWVRGDESRHWGVHRCCAVPGWPWGEECPQP